LILGTLLPAYPVFLGFFAGTTPGNTLGQLGLVTRKTYRAGWAPGGNCSCNISSQVATSRPVDAPEHFSQEQTAHMMLAPRNSIAPADTEASDCVATLGVHTLPRTMVDSALWRCWRKHLPSCQPHKVEHAHLHTVGNAKKGLSHWCMFIIILVISIHTFYTLCLLCLPTAPRV
jgi:hypothetical protein